MNRRTVGSTRSIYHGQGLDYEESRPYEPGDEIRFINWRMTARAGEPYTKVFRDERRPGVFIVLDRRDSMRFGTRVRLKVTQALRAVIAIAFGAARRNSTVGGVILESAPRWIPETSGELGAFELMYAANSPCPPIQQPILEPTLEQTVTGLSANLAPGTMIYLVSDFADLGTKDRIAFSGLVSRHDVFAIHIFDQAELQWPSTGRLQLSAHAWATPKAIDTSDPGSRAAYETAAQRYFDERRELFESLAVPYVLLPGDLDRIEDHIPLASI